MRTRRTGGKLPNQLQTTKLEAKNHSLPFSQLSEGRVAIAGHGVVNAAAAARTSANKCRLGKNFATEFCVRKAVFDAFSRVCASVNI